MAKFKIGDTVKVTSNNHCKNYDIGTVYVIDSMTPDSNYGGICFPSIGNGMYGEDLELIKTNIMTNISPMAEKLINADTKVLMETGIIDNSMNLTSKGLAALQALSFETHKESLVKLAKEEIK